MLILLDLGGQVQATKTAFEIGDRRIWELTAATLRSLLME
jgi:hypothetical protein